MVPAPPAALSPEEARRFYRWSHRLTSTLVRLRDLFDGDLDRYLLHSVRAVPRETTRRKLKLLADAGFLRQGPDGLHYLAGRYPEGRFLDDLGPLFGPLPGSGEPAPRSWAPSPRG